MTASNTAANSLLQATASPRLLGQTVSLYMLAMRGGLSLGALLMGVSSNVFGDETHSGSEWDIGGGGSRSLWRGSGRGCRCPSWPLR